MVLTPLEYGSVSIRLYPSQPIQSRQFISDLNCRPPLPHYSFTAHSNFFFSCCIQNGIGFLSGNLWTIYVHIIEVHWLDRSTMTNTANCLQKVAERSKLLPGRINFHQHYGWKTSSQKELINFIIREISLKSVKKPSCTLIEEVCLEKRKCGKYK